MGKRLTPEERQARIQAYEEAKAARAAERAEKRKARLEAYEKRLKKREFEKRGVKPVAVVETGPVATVKHFPTYRGKVEVGDEVGFRWLGTARAGIIVDYTRERRYKIQSDEEAEAVEKTGGAGSGFNEFYTIKDNSDGFKYPIQRQNILAKKINNKWYDSTN